MILLMTISKMVFIIVMIDILCMILSVIKLFIYITAFNLKSINRTINNHIMISFSVSIQELDRFIVFWSVEPPTKIDRKLLFNGCRIVFFFLFSTVVNKAYVIHLTQYKLQIIVFVCLKKLFADSRVLIIQKSQSLTEVCWIKRL